MFLKVVRCKSADWIKSSRGQIQLRAIVNEMKCIEISGNISWRIGGRGVICQLTGRSRLKNSLNFELVTFRVHKSRVIYGVATVSFRNSSVPHAFSLLIFQLHTLCRSQRASVDNCFKTRRKKANVDYFKVLCCNVYGWTD